MRSNGALYPIRGLAAKAAEHAARLGGIIAFVDNPQLSALENWAVEAGVELVQFYLNEALRLFGAAAINPDLLLAQKVLGWARAQPGLIALQSVYQYGPNAVRDKATATRIISVLEQHGLMRPIPGGTQIDGTHRRDVWEVRREPVSEV